MGVAGGCGQWAWLVGVVAGCGRGGGGSQSSNGNHKISFSIHWGTSVDD